MTAQFDFGPLEHRGPFLGLRPAQLLVGVSTTAVAGALFALSPTPAGAIGALCTIILGAGILAIPVAGRPLDQWLPVCLLFATRLLTHAARWSGPSNLRGHDVVAVTGGHVEVRDPVAGDQCAQRGRDPVDDERDGDPEHRWVLGLRRVDCGDTVAPYLRGVQILAARWRQGDVGVLKDARQRTYVGVIAARGRSFTLLDQDAKERLLAQWGAVLTTVSRDLGVITRLQWLERTVPDDSEQVVHHLAEHRVLPQSNPFVSSYLALLDEAGPQSQQHEVFIALQVSALRASPVIRRLRSGADIGACEVLSRELDAFAAGLQRAEVEVRGILSPRMLAAMLRQGCDPPAREQLAHRTAVNPESAGASPRTAFPRRSRTSWKHLRTEAAYHATYWVSEWPRATVGTDWIAPLLLGTRARRTVSVVMEPCAPTLALRRIEAARVDDATTRSLRQRLGFRTSVRKEREEQNVARAEEEINEGHQVLRVSAYITVTAATAGELEEACADVEQQARQARLDVQREYGLQDVAFTYTLPLCRGLQ